MGRVCACQPSSVAVASNRPPPTQTMPSDWSIWRRTWCVPAQSLGPTESHAVASAGAPSERARPTSRKMTLSVIPMRSFVVIEGPPETTKGGGAKHVPQQPERWPSDVVAIEMIDRLAKKFRACRRREPFGFILQQPLKEVAILLA